MPPSSYGSRPSWTLRNQSVQLSPTQHRTGTGDVSSSTTSSMEPLLSPATPIAPSLEALDSPTTPSRRLRSKTTSNGTPVLGWQTSQQSPIRQQFPNGTEEPRKKGDICSSMTTLQDAAPIVENMKATSRPQKLKIAKVGETATAVRRSPRHQKKDLTVTEINDVWDLIPSPGCTRSSKRAKQEQTTTIPNDPVTIKKTQKIRKEEKGATPEPLGPSNIPLSPITKVSPKATRSPVLSSFFVESKSKPSWSPTSTPKSKTTSPVYISKPSHQNQEIHSSKITKLTDRLQQLSSPKPSHQEALKTWDLLENLDDDTVKPRTTLRKKITLRSPKKEKEPEDRRAILRFFESDTFKPQEEKSPSPSPVIQDESSEKPIIRSQRLMNRTSRTYGNQRSYLADGEMSTKPDNETTSHSFHGQNTTINNEDTQEDDNLTSITHLRAQGSYAQFLDELNFILGGIESYPSLSSFLELAMRLLDDEFLGFVKNRGLPVMPIDLKLIDEPTISFVVGFIWCKVADSTGIDEQRKKVIKTLLSSTTELSIPRGSKNLQVLYREFQKSLKDEYNPVFVGITLLVQNGLYLDEELLPILSDVIIDFNTGTQIGVQQLNMVLMLLEAYLSKLDAAPVEFEKVYSFLSKHRTADSRTDMLKLKLYIVLAIKKFERVFDPLLISRSLKAALSSSNSELQLLHIGLMISLVENQSCLASLKKIENIKRLHQLYMEVSEESIPYFSLLLGMLYAESPLQVRKHFHSTEIERVVLELHRLEKGDTVISDQVRSILADIEK
ncbi:CYFA0S01e14620g1_1 [Cyberlindnera fabianii]|uniref:CYFA0S01e14620g1_1 n=1 Tax=Cyberlindnera fabianii TaxID=36022 RepID=A0A061AKK6_CYBFA|nr:CYFA0S01e14620g1_1 [Cyberlindnera fabianii]